MAVKGLKQTKMTAKELTKKGDKLQKKINELQGQLNILKQKMPTGYIRFYKSTKHREELFYAGKKTTLIKWLKEITKSYKIDLK